MGGDLTETAKIISRISNYGRHFFFYYEFNVKN